MSRLCKKRESREEKAEAAEGRAAGRQRAKGKRQQSRERGVRGGREEQRCREKMAVGERSGRDEA